ncbi:MAG: DUF1080 domain-containing protein, partial [Bacteroidaceae bacterium]|nr:DUF1080 domain-containing protein [Bacteroidaceae bacterium]
MKIESKCNIARKALYSCALSLSLLTSSCTEEQNKLTPEEVADGWVLLFDGKTMNGWKNYNSDKLTSWEAVDGTIRAKGDGSDASGYVVTDKQY